MPYILTFSRQVEVADSDLYINDCCIGGDVVLDRLLPSLKSRYGNDLQSNQEDWGWFAWLEDGPFKLAVDIAAGDDPSTFQVLLTSRRPGFIFGERVEDGAELDALRDLVMQQLTDWPVSALTVQLVDDEYRPV